MNHDYCQDPACKATERRPKGQPPPDGLSKPTSDGRCIHAVLSGSYCPECEEAALHGRGEPGPDGMSEQARRDEEAWWICSGIRTKLSRDECLLIQGHAESIYGERVKRAEEHSRKLCDSAVEGMREQEHEARRTAERLAEALAVDLDKARLELDELREYRDRLRDEGDAARAEVERLEREQAEVNGAAGWQAVTAAKSHYWKESALKVLNEHDAVCAEALREHPAPLGGSKAEHALKAIREQRAEVKRLKSRVEELTPWPRSVLEGDLHTALAMCDRLKARDSELEATLRYCVNGSAISPEEDISIASQLLARIDAERAGQAGDKPAVNLPSWCHATDCTCSLCSLTGASGPTERAKELAAAEAKGRREAFSEALRQFEVLRCYDIVTPMATFLHWLEEAAE